MPTIEACSDVNVPVQTAYPQSPAGVKQGKPVNTSCLRWNTEIVGKGVVTFNPTSDVMLAVVLQLAYIPEHVADGVEASSVRIQKELRRFKAFVESYHQW